MRYPCDELAVSNTKRLASVVAGAALALSFSGRARAATEAEATSPYDPVISTHGPVHLAVLGGFGFPRPLSIEGLVGVGDLVALGVEYSALPTMTIYGV